MTWSQKFYSIYLSYYRAIFTLSLQRPLHIHICKYILLSLLIGLYWFCSTKEPAWNSVSTQTSIVLQQIEFLYLRPTYLNFLFALVVFKMLYPSLSEWELIYVLPSLHIYLSFIFIVFLNRVLL